MLNYSSREILDYSEDLGSLVDVCAGVFHCGQDCAFLVLAEVQKDPHKGDVSAGCMPSRAVSARSQILEPLRCMSYLETLRNQCRIQQLPEPPCASQAASLDLDSAWVP